MSIGVILANVDYTLDKGLWWRTPRTNLDLAGDSDESIWAVIYVGGKETDRTSPSYGEG